ncbi:MAG: response regulator transcription factor [Prevotella sp.]|jgi:DNA-binding NarL/FixJ family response regulator|nr:response regulator transcription factor [Prevotella sp.]
MKTNIIIYDRQDITRLGMEALIKLCLRHGLYRISFVDTKKELLAELADNPDSLVVIDYTLSDFNSVDGLLNVSARFQNTCWILFSEDLSIRFMKKIMLCNTLFSVALKNADLVEIETAITCACNKKTYICSQVRNLMLMSETENSKGENVLTATEKEILKEIAWGRTAKEVAAARNISVYTVITHRKNIYRKLDVNNSQEASRYALRAGIIDASDYYI